MNTRKQYIKSLVDVGLFVEDEKYVFLHQGDHVSLSIKQCFDNGLEALYVKELLTEFADEKLSAVMSIVNGQPNNITYALLPRGTSETIAHLDFLNLWKVPIVRSGKDTIFLTYHVLERLGIQDIAQHVETKQQWRFTEVTDLLLWCLREIGIPVGETYHPRIFRLSNEEGLYGAAAMLDRDYMQEICKRIGDFWVVPNSVDDLVIVPMSSLPDVTELRNYLHWKNQRTNQEKILSYSIYAYVDGEFGVVPSDNDKEYISERFSDI